MPFGKPHRLRVDSDAPTGVVMPAVVGTFEFGDFIPPGESA